MKNYLFLTSLLKVNMKKFFGSTWLMLILLFLLGSCSSSEDSSEIAKKTEDVSVICYSSKSNVTKTMPRLIIDFKDFSLTEISDKESKNRYDFLMVSHIDGKSWMISANEGYVMIARYNPVKNEMADEVLIFANKGDAINMIMAKMDWQENSYEVLDSKDLGISTKLRALQTSRSSNSTAGAARKAIVKQLEKIGKKLDDLDLMASLMPGEKTSVGEIFNVWDRALLVAKYNMYMDDEEEQELIANEIAETENFNYLVKKVFTGKANVMYKAVKSAWNKLVDSDVTDSEIDDYAGCLVWRSRASVPVVWKVYYADDELKVVINSIYATENSATISATCTPLGGQMTGVVKSGFKYGEINGTTEHTSYDYLNGKITGLKKGTDYYVRAFVQTIHKTYFSKPAYFTTDGATMSLSLHELSYNEKGGSKGVYVFTEGAIKSWSITSAPQWCKIQRAANSFFVDVAECEYQRSGTIVVEAYVENGDVLREEIQVVQAGKSLWNGTKWKLTLTASEYGDIEKYNSNLDIVNVEKNQFELSDFGVLFSQKKTIKITEDNHLLITAEYKDGKDTDYITLDLYQTDESHIKGKMIWRSHYYSEIDETWDTIEAIVQVDGTLISRISR